VHVYSRASAEIKFYASAAPLSLSGRLGAVLYFSYLVWNLFLVWTPFRSVLDVIHAIDLFLLALEPMSETGCVRVHGASSLCVVFIYPVSRVRLVHFRALDFIYARSFYVICKRV